MFDLAENIEKALKSLFAALGELLASILQMSFCPQRLARRRLSGETSGAGPYTLLAIAAFLFSKTTKIIWALTLGLALRSCGEDDTQLDEATVKAAYLKSELTWPSADDVLITALPIIVFVLGLGWLSRKAQGTKAVATEEGLPTQGICYAVGAQFLLMAPIAALFVNVIGRVSKAGIGLAMYPALTLIVIWPVLSYYRFVQFGQYLVSDAAVYLKRNRIILLATGLLSSTVPLYLTQMPTPEDKSMDYFWVPAIGAAALHAELNKETGETDVFISIVNNSDLPLLISRLCVEPAKSIEYCGPFVEDDRLSYGKQIDGHKTEILHARVKRIALVGNQKEKASESSNADISNSTLDSPPLPGSFPGRVTLTTYTFKGEVAEVTATLRYGSLPQEEFN